MSAPSADPLKFQEAIDAWRKRVPMTTDEWDALQESEQSFAFTVANVTSVDVVADVWEALDSSIANGTDFADFKKDIGEALAEEWGEEIPGRMETIFRTNVMSAYSEGRHAVYSAPAVKEARPFLRFDAIHDDRTDDDCDACDGVLLDQDDSWWKNHTPPLHPNCRCMLTPISQDEVDKEDGPDDEGPEVEVADGFGGKPSSSGKDWKDPGEGLPDPLLNILNERLAG